MPDGSEKRVDNDVVSGIAEREGWRGGARQTALGLSAESDIFRGECGQTPEARNSRAVTFEYDCFMCVVSTELLSLTQD